MENQKQEMSIELPQFTQVNKRQTQNVIALKIQGLRMFTIMKPIMLLQTINVVFLVMVLLLVMESELQNHAYFGADGMISN